MKFLTKFNLFKRKKMKKWEMKIILAVWQFTQSSTEKDTTLYFLQILFRFDRACRSNHNFWQGKVHFWPVVTDSKQIRKFPSSHLLFYRFTQSLDCLASESTKSTIYWAVTKFFWSGMVTINLLNFFLLRWPKVEKIWLC